GVVHGDVEAGAYQVGRHGPAHVADADKTHSHTIVHACSAPCQSRPCAASASFAAAIASTPVGMPAYTAVCMMISRISSTFTPLARAPRTCTFSWLGLVSAVSAASVIMLRALRSRPGRCHTSPKTQLVTRSSKGRLK